MAQHGDSLAVAVGETLEFLVRMQDRNKGDTTVIRVREDPGLPPGRRAAELGDKSQSQVCAQKKNTVRAWHPD